MRDLLGGLAQLRERKPEILEADAPRLQELKTELLGRKAGALTDILKQLPTLDPDTRKAVGAEANVLKQELEGAIADRERALAAAARKPTGVDLTMPGRPAWRGGLHLTTQVVNEICGIFAELGFTRAVGPEAETERNNFFALNFPPDHPALDSQDSFYLGKDTLLRTHTRPRCRCGPSRRTRRPSGWSFQAGCIAAIRSTPPTRPSSSRSRAWWWMRASRSST